MRLSFLTWHVHGTYLQMLGGVGHDIYVPVRPGRPPRYAGLPPGRSWPAGLFEIPAEDVASLPLDGIIYQCDENWTEDREILSEDQRRLPAIYVEHDPPGASGSAPCFGERHLVAGEGVRIVHVTPFNALMWDCSGSPTAVVEHGVPDRGSLYRGEKERGIVVVNNFGSRARRLGLDIYLAARRRVPLDLVGLGSEDIPGGLGEVPPDELAGFMAGYRFYFHPVRYTSLGMALCEAMMAGMPPVAVAATEAPGVIRDGETGFVSSDVPRLVAGMEALLEDGSLARRLGSAARRTALHRFSPERFRRDWDRILGESARPGSRGSAPTPREMDARTGTLG